MQDRSSLQSSAILRTLIHAKRNRGQMVEATVLARLGARLASEPPPNSADADDISRKALTRYLELMPGDAEVQQALATLPPPAPRPQQRDTRRGLMWFLFIGCGTAAAGAIHVYGFPEPPPPPPARVLRMKVPLPPVVLPPPTPVVIRAVGDVVLGSTFPAQRLPNKEERTRLAALHDSLRQADVVVGNLEGVLSDHGKVRKDTSRPGLFAFRMPESNAAMLRAMGFDVLSLANNHSLDFGADGLAYTIRALTAQGIRPVGVPGAEMAEMKVRGTSIAFLNYSYLPTFVRLDDEQAIRTAIERAHQAADLVVVSVHAGREGASAAGHPDGDEYFMNEYRGNIRKFAQFAIDCGASVVFGHGPHVVRPYEIYKGKPIFFSLGNFVGYRSLSTRGQLANSIIAEVRFSPKGEMVGAGVIPLKLDKSGIPAVDYDMANLATLDQLLDKQLDKRPVLELSAQSAVAPATKD
jgi:hypothetical protein